MAFKRNIILGVLITASVCFGADQLLNKKRFPKDFMFGFATSAYQIEGAWKTDGKGVHVWDTYTHLVPSPIKENDTGDVACDSYHRYKEDIALMKEMGVSHYRFSIMWTRILPTGFTNEINQAGIDFYKNLIKELRLNNIEPVVTLFHWDTPQNLENFGGMLNEYIVDRFADYARICFENFGDDVKYWMTFNEPITYCYESYGTNRFPPNDIYFPGIGEYVCGHNLLKSHARIYHIYHEEFKPKQKGLVSMVVSAIWYEPKTAADIEAAERANQFGMGWFAHPIYRGDYSEAMRTFIERKSLLQGFRHSRLPRFTEAEIDYIRGTGDYFAMNYYSTRLVTDSPIDLNSTTWTSDSNVIFSVDPEWKKAASDYIYSVPWGMRKMLNWIRRQYGDVAIFIAENGWSDTGTIIDDDRIEYIQSHLSSLRDAIDDGVNVIGYSSWSLIDNLEWSSGYTEKFGIYHVDFNCPNRTRTPKKSVGYVKNVYSTRCVVDDSECFD